MRYVPPAIEDLGSIADHTYGGLLGGSSRLCILGICIDLGSGRPSTPFTPDPGGSHGAAPS